MILLRYVYITGIKTKFTVSLHSTACFCTYLLILYRNTIPESLIGTITEGEFNEVLVSGKIKGRHCEPTKRHSHDSSN